MQRKSKSKGFKLRSGNKAPFKQVGSINAPDLLTGETKERKWGLDAVTLGGEESSKKMKEIADKAKNEMQAFEQNLPFEDQMRLKTERFNKNLVNNKNANNSVENPEDKAEDVEDGTVKVNKPSGWKIAANMLTAGLTSGLDAVYGTGRVIPGAPSVSAPKDNKDDKKSYEKKYEALSAEQKAHLATLTSIEEKKKYIDSLQN